MNGITKRVVGFGALAGLVIAGVIGINAINVSGDDGIGTPASEPWTGGPQVGTLTLSVTDRGGTVTYTPAGAGATPLVQQIEKAQPCNALNFIPMVGAQGNLLSLTPRVNGATSTANTVQIPSDGIGVHDGTNCGGPAGLVGPREELIVGVGSYFPSVVAISSANLIIGKSGAQDDSLLKVAFDDGDTLANQVVPYPTSISGFTITNPADTLPGPNESFKTFTVSSTAKKNSNGLSVKSGTTLTLVAPGSFDTAVDCGEHVTTDIGNDGDIAIDAVFYRGENLAKQTTACSDVGVTIEILPDNPNTPSSEASVFWNNGQIGVNGLPQAVSGTVTINWAGVTDPAKLNRTIDYDAAGTAFDWQPVVWCTSFTTSDPDSDDILTFTATRPKVTQTNGTGADVQVDAPWCLVSDERTLVDGEIKQTQVYYGQGDPQVR